MNNTVNIIDNHDINRGYCGRYQNSQYGGGQSNQSFNNSQDDHRYNNQYCDDPRQYADHRSQRNSNQYQDNRGFSSQNPNNWSSNDSNMGWQQSQVSNNFRSQQYQSTNEPSSKQILSPTISQAQNNSFVSGSGTTKQRPLIDLDDRQTAAYNAIKYGKISINMRIILTANSTRDEALQVISNPESAFHDYHHQEYILSLCRLNLS